MAQDIPHHSGTSTVGPASVLESSLLHITVTLEEKSHLQYQEKFACHTEKNFFIYLRSAEKQTQGLLHTLPRRHMYP